MSGPASKRPIRQAKQLELPIVCAPAAPVIYLEMDGTGIPVVMAETQAAQVRLQASPLVLAK